MTNIYIYFKFYTLNVILPVHSFEHTGSIISLKELYFYYTIIESVDYGCRFYISFLRDKRSVVAVNMSVKKELRMVFMYKLIETFKSSVRHTVEVV